MATAKALATKCNSKVQICDVYYTLGMMDLAKGNKKAAAKWLHHAVNTKALVADTYALPH